MIRTALAVSMLGALLVVSGCGVSGRVSESQVKQVTPSAPVAKSDQGKPSTEQPQSAGATDNAQASRAKPANQAFPEIAFQPVIWMGGGPTAPAGGGVWVYTKDQHPANIASIDWDRKDLLPVQLPTERYPGYKLEVTALQPIAADAVRIVCRLTPPITNNSVDMQRHPRTYVVIDAGAIAGKRFVIVDDSLKELATE
jgi:hypothetical protein